MKSIKDADIKLGTRVLVRCDLDVPLDENGGITDTFRLDHMLPTLNLIIEKQGIPVIMGHIGRPEGKVDPKLSTDLLKPYFDKNLNGSYELLENLRFDAREKENSEEFAKELASKGEIYVNESFATSHREHTSMVGIAKFIPSFAGLRLEKEISVLDGLLVDPARPFVAIIGGAKLESKKPAVKKFLEIADAVLVGGRIGLDWDEDLPAQAGKPDNLFLPVDYEDELDIGSKTIDLFSDIIAEAKTIVWAGPMGKFEDYSYVQGTELIAHEVGMSSAFSVVGGGDTIAALKYIQFLDKMSFVSTGGGAMLEFLISGTLPAIEVLE